MNKIPNMSGILRGNCCETCHIPQKTPMNGFTKKNPLTRKMLYRNACRKEKYTYIYFGIAKDSSDCFWQSNLFFLYRQHIKK